MYLICMILSDNSKAKSNPDILCFFIAQIRSRYTFLGDIINIQTIVDQQFSIRWTTYRASSRTAVNVWQKKFILTEVVCSSTVDEVQTVNAFLLDALFTARQLRRIFTSF